jgi:hypothetical protein
MMIHDKISLPCWLFGFKMLIETILMYGGTYLIYIYIYMYVCMYGVLKREIYGLPEMKGKEMYMPSSCGGFVTWLYIMWSLHMP